MSIYKNPEAMQNLINELQHTLTQLRSEKHMQELNALQSDFFKEMTVQLIEQAEERIAELTEAIFKYDNDLTLLLPTDHYLEGVQL